MKTSRSSWANKAVRGALCLGLLAGLTACAARPPGPPKPPGLVQAAALAERLRQRATRIQSFVGRGRLRLQVPRAQYHADFWLAALRPGQLRLQAFDLFGRPVLALAVNQGELHFLDYGQAKLYRGPATPANLARFLPAGLSVPQIITLLAGGQPLSEAAQAEVRPTEEGPLLLRLLRPGGLIVEQVWLDPDRLRVARLEVGPVQGEPWFRVEYAEYKEVGDLALPFRIHLADPRHRTELALDYDDFQPQAPLPGEIFSLPAPPGVKVIELPEESEGGA